MNPLIGAALILGSILGTWVCMFIAYRKLTRLNVLPGHSFWRWRMVYGLGWAHRSEPHMTLLMTIWTLLLLSFGAGIYFIMGK